MIEVRSAEGQGRGYFAKEGGVISAGTIVLESSAIVAVVKDGQEDRTCRRERGVVYVTAAVVVVVWLK